MEESFWSDAPCSELWFLYTSGAIVFSAHISTAYSFAINSKNQPFNPVCLMWKSLEKRLKLYVVDIDFVNTQTRAKRIEMPPKGEAQWLKRQQPKSP
jgi:hypothetical protein